MRLHRTALCLALVAGFTGAASAQENRGTMEQQMACTPDVWRLCSEQVPDVGRITTCLRQNTPQLSGACRAVFESNASGPQPAVPQQQAQPRRRVAQPRIYQAKPALPADDDQ